MFGELWRAGELVGLAGALPGGRFEAWLDEDGDLHMNPVSVEALSEAFPMNPSKDFLEEIETNLQVRCLALLSAADQAARSAPTLDEAGARAALVEVGTRVADLFPYPILTKVVPGLLLRALQAAGDQSAPPLPSPSPGALLSRAVLDLYLACAGWGYPPERLEAAWPEVPEVVAAEVHRFCAEQTGFGPVPWESAGYESPRYAFAAMRAAFGGVELETLRARRWNPGQGDEDPPEASPEVLNIRRVLRTWLEYMDREIWYMRGAFYRSMLPLLRRIAGSWVPAGLLAHPEDLLFAEVDEIAAGPPARDVLAARRRRYLEDADYLTKHGIGPATLAAAMEGP